MSTQRVASPVTSFAAFYKSAATRSSASTLRSFSCARYLRQSSKRELYTAPSYQSHTLPDSFPPPPRNSGIPDTSIAGPKPTTGNNKEWGFAQSSGWGVGTNLQEAASISVPESEAQKSKPVAHPTQAPSSDAKPRRSKLRPRKAPMTVTPAAVTHLRELLSGPNPKMIRVGTKNRGCSGMAYHLEYVENANKLDEIVEQDGVKVLIDSKALFTMIGSEMDWQEDKLQARFVFKNPNIKEQCGCGESFMI